MNPHQSDHVDDRQSPTRPPGYERETPAKWTVKSLVEAERVINIQHRMLCADADNIAHLYERIGWVCLPWWKRVYRRRPW